MNKLKQTGNWIKEHYIITAIVVLIVAFVGYKVFAGNGEKIEVATADVGNVVQKVIVSGKTKAVEEVMLGFENNGKISQTNVTVGSRVVIGQVLASLNTAEQNANLLRARADLTSSEAKLTELKKGTRPEEIAIAETSLANAKIALIDAESNLSAKITDAHTKADDAVHNTIDQFFSNARSGNPTFNLTVYDNQQRNDIIDLRIRIEPLLVAWRQAIDANSPNIISITNDNLNQVKTFIDKVAIVVNNQTSNSSLSQTTVDGYKTDVSTARTNITTAISTVSTAVEKLNSAKSSVKVAEENLNLKKVGNTPETIQVQEAIVMQYRAQVEAVEAQISKMILRSPLNGLVTKQDAKVGEIVTPGKTVISVISDSNLEIEANVSEINIGKVSIGNPVQITLDAFPGEVFRGTVTYVEPAETIIDGVVNYKVTVSINDKNPNLKSGLTANLEIITNTKTGVIRIPKYSLINENNQYFVMRSDSQDNKSFTKIPVSIGLIGQDGLAEVISGLSSGDVVKISLIEN